MLGRAAAYRYTVEPLASFAPVPGRWATTVPGAAFVASTGMVTVFRPAACSAFVAAAACWFCTDGTPPPPGDSTKRLTGVPWATVPLDGASQPVASVFAVAGAPDGCTGPVVSPAAFSADSASPSDLPQIPDGTGTCLAATPTTTATAWPGFILNPGPGFWPTTLPTWFADCTTFV